MARNRVIYQSEALYVSPNATGYHYATGQNGTAKGLNNLDAVGAVSDAMRMTKYTGVAGAAGYGSTGTLVEQLTRVQSANYSFTVNRQDINEYGKLARIDAISLEPPTVSLDFTYYITDGRNELLLDFPIDGATSAASGHLQSRPGQNFFIMTAAEGSDAQGLTNENHKSSDIIGLGNGFLSDYTVEGSVGSLPTASVTIEGFNLIGSTGTVDVDTPAVSLENGTKIADIKFSLPKATGDNDGTAGIHDSTSDISALRPGDISLTFNRQNGPGKWEYPSLLNTVTGSDAVDANASLNIQSFTLSLPLARTPIDRLGSKFAFARVVDFPVVATMTISALAQDLKTGDLVELLDDTNERDIRVSMKKPGTSTNAMFFDLRGARLDSESVSSDIGSNKSVDLTYSAQIGGPEDNSHGVFISGIFQDGQERERTNFPSAYNL
tara:strand:+ start:63 stop:1376 length:1314 start_codon:yes stop_codon:yes gene_type:complete